MSRYFSDPWASLSPRLRGNRVVPVRAQQPERSIPAPAEEPRTTTTRWPPKTVYPRARGGTADVIAEVAFARGLSPRLRGNRPPCLNNQRIVGGSIPAPAGEPTTMPMRPDKSRVYPRACGGTTLTAGPVDCWPGLSPRLRGNPDGRVRHVPEVGSIPAPAGEPRCCDGAVGACTVYPRACGGTSPGYFHPIQTRGLSPRLRDGDGRIVTLRNTARAVNLR